MSDFWVARAIALNLIKPEEVSPKTLQALQSQIEQRRREIEQGEDLVSDELKREVHLETDRTRKP